MLQFIFLKFYVQLKIDLGILAGVVFIEEMLGADAEVACYTLQNSYTFKKAGSISSPLLPAHVRIIPAQ
ncbi:hypothetical protein J31TS6_12300 [Brevibacillus reuszeri]|nr:hypothetical protein J31TS6_12300 [Brevibacillus reuszeri]